MNRKKQMIRMQSIVLTILLLFSTLLPPALIFAEGVAVDKEEQQEQEADIQTTSSLTEVEGAADNEGASENDATREKQADTSASKSANTSESEDSAEKESDAASEDDVQQVQEKQEVDEIESEEPKEGEGSNGIGIDESKADKENTEEASLETEEKEKEEIKSKQAEEREPITIEENIMKDGSLTLTKADGTPVNADEVTDLKEGLQLEFDWELPNGHLYMAGDTFELQLPEQFEGVPIPNGSLGEYGSFTVDENGLVTFTFSEEIEKQSNISGHFSMNVELDEKKITKTEDVLEFTVNDEVVERIAVNYKPTGGQAIQKNGKHADDRKFNTEAIDWTVDLNTTLESLTNAQVKDVLKENQALDLDSIELYEAAVNIKGEIIGVKDEPVDLSGINQSNKNKLVLNLGDTNKAYRLKFKTNITDDEATKYSNTAVLTSEGKKDASSGATISVGRQEHLKKTSSKFNKENHSVSWKVEYNFDEKQLEKGNKLTDEFSFTVGKDTFNDKFEVTDIIIKEVESFNDNGSVKEAIEVDDVFDYEVVGNKVTYTLQKDTKKPYIIEYKTALKDGEYITHNGEISNTVEVDGKTKTSKQGVHQQVGKKSNKGINYEDKTIEWEIKINQDKQDLRNFILKDSFHDSGQELVVDSINIEPAKENITPKVDRDKQGFTIDFGNIKDTYTITYKTVFTYDFGKDKKPNFVNNLNLDYETSDGSDYNLEIKDTVKPNKKTTSNGAKNGRVDQETKEITWDVDINYNQLELKDAKFEDPIAENQSLIADSIQIYETSVTPKGDVKLGNEVTGSHNIQKNDGEKINIDFGEIDQSYRIVFKTKDKDDIYNSNEKYTNTASFIPREGELHELDAHVTIPKQGQFLGKSGQHNKGDWTIDWKVNINESRSKLTDVIVTDDLGDEALQLLLEDSIKLTKGKEELEEGEDYTLVTEGNRFTLKIHGEITDHHVLTYSSYILASETADLTNDAKLQSNEEVVGSTTKEESVTVKLGQASGGGKGETGGLVLKKVDKDSGQPLKDVAFTLQTTIGNQEIVVREGVTNKDGEIHWSGLKYGTYTLLEKLPDGYLGEKTIEVTLDDKEMSEGTMVKTIENERKKGRAKIIKVDAVTGEELPNAIFELTNKDTKQQYEVESNEKGIAEEEVPFGRYDVKEIKAPEGYKVASDIPDIEINIDKTTEVVVENDAIVDVSGKKTWHDDERARPKSITVQLFGKDKSTPVAEKVVKASDQWEYTFKNQPKYDQEGNEINYTIDEKPVKGYQKKIDGFDLINTQTMDITGEKTWKDDNSEDRPKTIKVNLLQNESVIDTKEVTAEDDWKYSFTDLAKYDENGKAYAYTVKEQGVPGYESKVDGYDITNTRSEKTSVEVTKSWLDDDSKDRPSAITVTLLQNGEDFDTQEITAANDWTYVFEDLEAYDENGKAYAYTIEEDPVEGYKTTVDGYDLTNLRTGKTEVSGEKTWKDDNSEDRPKTIKVNLLQNESVIDTKEVTAEDDWKYSFTDLEQYDENGVAYAYTIEEAPVEGYKTTVDGYDITNLRTGKTEVSGEKTWKDDNSEDRPKTIKVNLLQNKSVIDTKEVTAEDDWKYSFTDLAKYDENGKAYAYTVKEQGVPGYESKVDGYDITNTRSEKTSVEVTKSWLDDDSKDRPSAITVTLLQNGEDFDTQEITAANDWTYVFEDLEAYDENGKAYEYTIEEDPVEGYKTTVDGYDLTNLRTGKTEVSGEKTWKDDNSEDRPASITVKLFQNGKEIDSKEVTAKDEWKYSFTDLEQYDENGKAFVYTIEESPVEGYKTTVDGYDLTNLRTGKTEVSGKKTWKDDNAEDRPESIKVTLFQNGKEIDSKTVTAEDDWTYRFLDLDKYDGAGKLYEYTIEEDPVKGYKSKVDGYDITNTRSEKTSVEVTKSWLDDDSKDRPSSITVTLLQNGEDFDTQEITAANDWTYVFEDLEQYDENGKAYAYTIEEAPVEGYKTTIDGYDITNLRTGKTEVSGEKTWKDDNSEDRPKTIKVNLLQNKSVIDTKEVTAEDDWKYSFTDLAKYDENGKAYAYTVKEQGVPGYESKVDGYDITNTRSEKTSVEVTKSWLDDDSKDRPSSITVTLLQNGEDFDTQEITAANDWTYVFEDLEAYDENGKAYAYTIEEDPVEGYKTTVDGYDLTNLRTGKTEVSGEKTWKDDNSEDRPASITIKLFQNGKEIDSKEVTAKDKWKYSFTDLEQYDENGVAYKYTIDEQPVKGYETVINGYDITNIRTEKTSIDVEKVWEDKGNEDRPTSITVKLLQNGDVFKTVDITAANDWTYVFEDLEAYDENGKAYAYTIEESPVKAYETTVKETEAGYEITNTLIEQPEKQKPENPKPTDPMDPKDPAESNGDPKDPSKDPADPTVSDDTSEEDGNKLPSTATNIFNIFLIGAGLVLAGMALLIYRKKASS